MKRRLRSRATKPVSDAPLAALTAAWLRISCDPAAAKTSEVIPPREGMRGYDSAMARRLFAGVVAALGLAGSSSAGPVTWVFEGHVTHLASDSPETLATLSSLGVSLGGFFSGQLVFESATADQDPDPAWGDYPGAVSFLSVTIGSFHEEVSVLPGDYSWMGVEAADSQINLPALLYAEAGGPGGSSGIFDERFLKIYLGETAPGQIVGDFLPLAPPGLDMSEGANDEFQFYADTTIIDGKLTLLQSVPEPGLSALLGLSLAAAGALRRRSP